MSSDPGSRAGAALHYDSVARTLYLYGGRDSQGTRGDLWYFDLDTQAWTLVSNQAAPGAPPPMERAAIAVCNISGAISVLAGQVEGGSATEPAWRYRMGQWQSYSELGSAP